MRIYKYIIYVYKLTLTFSPYTSIKGTAGSVSDHNKLNISIKWVKWIFGFPVHIKVMFILYCSLLNEIALGLKKAMYIP